MQKRGLKCLSLAPTNEAARLAKGKAVRDYVLTTYRALASPEGQSTIPAANNVLAVQSPARCIMVMSDCCSLVGAFLMLPDSWKLILRGRLRLGLRAAALLYAAAVPLAVTPFLAQCM